MGLDYTDGCVNFRDFGAYINLILDEQKLPEGKFYRGGSIDYVKEHTEIAQTHTIINLRNRADYTEFDADYFHFPMENKVEKYDTTQKEVRVWLNNVIKTFENPAIRYPVLIHCLSGKDRTGIVVAALLLIMGISKEVVEEEYLLSEGEVQSSLIQQAISGIEDLDTYFNRVDLAKVKGSLLS